VPEEYAAHLRTQPAPAYTLWTYWELGGDILEGFPHRENRKALWIRIIKALGWPKGSIAFAPMSIVDQGKKDLCPSLDIFSRYLDRIDPVYILCFGLPAARTLFPESGAENEKIYRGKRVFLLPEPHVLAANDVQAKKEAWAVLQRLSP
jgi:hypothetical protein